MSDKMNKELNEAEINQIIDEEIDAYLEENSVGGGAMAFAPGAVKEEEVDEGRRGRHIDPHAHKYTRRSKDEQEYFFRNPRPWVGPKLIPKQLTIQLDDDGEPVLDDKGNEIYVAWTGQTETPSCSLHFSDVPGTYPQGHPEYNKTPIDPETGMPVEAKTVHGMANRHNLHKWMCANPMSKPIPITAKPRPKKFRGSVTAGDPFPPDGERVFKEGISLRVTTPDTLDEI